MLISNMQSVKRILIHRIFWEAYFLEALKPGYTQVLKRKILFKCHTKNP